MEESLNSLIEEFSNLDKESQQKEISEQLKTMLTLYGDILKKLGSTESIYLNKYMHLEEDEQEFNELVYAYLKSIEDVTGKILLRIDNWE